MASVYLTHSELSRLDTKSSSSIKRIEFVQPRSFIRGRTSPGDCLEPSTRVCFLEAQARYSITRVAFGICPGLQGP